MPGAVPGAEGSIMSAIIAIVQIWRERVQKAVWGGTCLGSPVACWVFVAAEPNYPAFPEAEERCLLPRDLAQLSGEQRQM